MERAAGRAGTAQLAIASRPWIRCCARVAALALHRSPAEEKVRIASRAAEALLSHTADGETTPSGPSSSAAWLALAGPVAAGMLQVVPSAWVPPPGRSQEQLAAALLGLALGRLPAGQAEDG
eukprot:CAMPEP_0117681576 /NCGR_PEP_ID=MMETSP0804-20121206/19068_1 /TAXON_ID=1074897 /ORGANISM="Tetraselmis astigmatica, Strain CCMP880" /LENGTH=121 /DNA_ID=CAMNT_0005491367 /DNA_START=1 /DNA_END=363 /DNA_ORIENTATION=+